MKPQRKYEALLAARENHRDDEATFLSAQGWRQTCDTPGSLWLWETQYKGKTILVSQDVAMRIEGSFLSGIYER